MNLPETIRNANERHGLVPVGSRVIAAVSGGADSVALLRILHSLDIPVTVAHLNHRLRGPESDADEAFVREIAGALGLPFVAGSADVKALASAGGLSIEMAARQARHDFFSGFGDAAIALAHHADDQVETFLLKLARGSGTEGLSGMPYCQTIGSMRLIRPMLDIPRSRILAWLAAGGYPWREDASNADEYFPRNRVRHTILPLLERELNPAIRETILRTMDILREENEWMDSLTGSLEPDSLSALPRAGRRRALRRWLFGQGATDVTYDAVEGILALMEKGDGSRIHELSARQRVVVEYGRPRLENRNNQPAKPSWMLHRCEGTGWKTDHGKGLGILPAEASFDAARMGDSPVEVRTFQPGDRIEPLGMEGSRKLQDIFTDQKIPQAQRSRIPVVVCRGEIIWLPGYRTARGWAVQGEHGKSVHLRIEHNPAV